MFRSRIVYILAALTILSMGNWGCASVENASLPDELETAEEEPAADNGPPTDSESPADRRPSRS